MMTREKAIRFFKDCSVKCFELRSTDEVVELKSIKAIIHQIYDELGEERVCKNCKHFRKMYEDVCLLGISCKRPDTEIDEEYGCVYEDFGCNSFEKVNK